MSIISSVQNAVVPFVNRVQEMIGTVIFDYTGIMTSNTVNEVVFYIVGAFMVYLVWLVIKPSESVYYYRTQHRH